MTGQLLFMAAMGVVLGVCGGYPWGRVLRRRDRHEAWDAGYEAACIDHRVEVMPLDAEPEAGERLPGLVSLAAGPPSLAGGPLPAHDWREEMALELAPEALALQVPLPSVDEGLQRDVPRSLAPGPDEGRLTNGHDGPGHPSPYQGQLTPAQRRRDKHKHRGQYAPAPGWTADPEHVMASHWKPEGDRWMAEWRIEWQDDVAAVDEEIAGWVERQRLWLAADRWDRGARRLGAVA